MGEYKMSGAGVMCSYLADKAEFGYNLQRNRPTLNPNNSLCPDVPDLTDRITHISEFPVAMGGFSDIHEARLQYRSSWIYEIHERKVAVKALRCFTRQGITIQRATRHLKKEVAIWQRCHHKNIAEFIGTCSYSGGRPCVVMKWYKNGASSEYLVGRPVNEKMTTFKDIALGLRYLHGLTISHGDLKGNNVLITDEGRGVLTDFGLSKVIDELSTVAGTNSLIAGSLRWQPPELLLEPDEDDDEHSEILSEKSHPNYDSGAGLLQGDVWSFASTFYELLTEKLPYHQHPTDFFVISDILRGKSPVQARPQDALIHDYAGGQLKKLLDNCWLLKGEDRPVIGEVVQELEKLELLERNPSKL